MEMEPPVTEVIHTAREIEAMLPHRWPFLLVDRIIEFDAAQRRIVGVKGVTGTEWFFQGHFPGMPIMPGVLQVEALAQTMGVAMAKLDQENGAPGPKMGVFAAIDEVRFKRIVTPGDQLRLECWIDKSSRKLIKGHGVATVDGEVTCEAVMTAFVVDPRSLR
jgi:3-hydroxyacyl-[acyl-carrier-protein] dehydratase